MSRIKQDHSRVREIVRGRIRQNLKKYISRGELIGKQGKDQVKIPLPPPPRQRNFFDSLAHLADSLEEPRPLFFDAAMDEAIAAIDDHVGGLAGAQALLGARAARLEAETERLDRSQLELKSSLSKLEDTDMTEAIARLNRLSVVLEAAQASFARVSRLSLWDDIR